jgi:hypothetical protein
MRELNSLRKVVNPYYGNGKRTNAPEYNADPPRTRPGGWAYPGTMVVGDGGTPVNGTMHGGMSKDENRVHFGGALNARCLAHVLVVYILVLIHPAHVLTPTLSQRCTHNNLLV